MTFSQFEKMPENVIEKNKENNSPKESQLPTDWEDRVRSNMALSLFQLSMETSHNLHQKTLRKLAEDGFSDSDEEDEQECCLTGSWKRLFKK